MKNEENEGLRIEEMQDRRDAAQESLKTGEAGQKGRRTLIPVWNSAQYLYLLTLIPVWNSAQYLTSSENLEHSDFTSASSPSSVVRTFYIRTKDKNINFAHTVYHNLTVIVSVTLFARLN